MPHVRAAMPSQANPLVLVLARMQNNRQMGKANYQEGKDKRVTLMPLQELQDLDEHAQEGNQVFGGVHRCNYCSLCSSIPIHSIQRLWSSSLPRRVYFKQLTMSENGHNSTPTAFIICSGQGYNLNSFSVHLIMCVVDLFIGTSISLLVSKSEYVVPRSLMICTVCYFYIKI